MNARLVPSLIFVADQGWIFGRAYGLISSAFKNEFEGLRDCLGLSFSEEERANAPAVGRLDLVPWVLYGCRPFLLAQERTKEGPGKRINPRLSSPLRLADFCARELTSIDTVIVSAQKVIASMKAFPARPS